MTEQEYFNNILNKEEISEKDLANLVWCYEVDCVSGECHRWTQSVKSIVELCGRYFAIDWDRGLTEMQENYFYNQPYEVKKIEKMVKVTEWVKKGANNE